MRRRIPTNVADSINRVAEEINHVLDSREKKRYFESIVLLHSLVENVLRWLVFLKLLWDRSSRVLKDEEVRNIARLARELNYYRVIRAALALGIIDLKLMKVIDELRDERNDLVHQAWLYEHRSDHRVLRKKLEKLARTTSRLVGAANKITKKISIDEVYEAYP